MTAPNLRSRLGVEFDLDSADTLWLELLDQASAADSAIHELEQLVKSDGLLATGSKGQMTIHPAVVELRHQRAAYARLLMLLDVSEDETQSHRQARNARKRFR